MASQSSRDIQQAVYGVLGQDIQYSLSPAIFRHVFALLKWQAVYAIFDRGPARLERFVKAAPDAGIAGFNVTKPYKVEIIEHLNRLDTTARDVGAVNAVACRSTGGVGYNTDIDGVDAALASYRKRLTGKPVLIVGAGGAARATAYALVKRFGVTDITFVVRSPKRAERVARDLDDHLSRVTFDIVHVDKLEGDPRVKAAALIVNATPVGTGSERNRLPISPRVDLSPRTVVFDLIYRPRQTRFLERAQRAGCRTVSGWPMLIAQAEAAFRIWTGRDFPKKARRQLLNWDPDR
ncbi:MAG: hypothetical protein GF341_04395 [candidate division Zixibacteria bacterium]|nr:hypothetical protein [candidate division Zixibacteria bacterium]